MNYATYDGFVEESDLLIELYWNVNTHRAMLVKNSGATLNRTIRNVKGEYIKEDTKKDGLFIELY